jgi:MFS family permease
MVKLLPLVTLSSYSQAIFATLFVPLMTDAIKANPETQSWVAATSNKHCLLALVGFGVGEIVGGLALGKIMDKIGNKASLVLCLVLMLVGTAAALAFIFIFSFTLWLAVIMTFTWGVQDGALNNLLFCIMDFQFES